MLQVLRSLTRSYAELHSQLRLVSFFLIVFRPPCFDFLNAEPQPVSNPEAAFGPLGKGSGLSHTFLSAARCCESVSHMCFTHVTASVLLRFLSSLKDLLGLFLFSIFSLADVRVP